MSTASINTYQDRAIWRYTLGVTLCVAVAIIVKIDLSFVIPVFSLSFLFPGNHVPSIKEGIWFVLTIAIACVLGVLLSWAFLTQPGVLILISMLIIFHIFYTTIPAISAVLKVWLIIAILLIPNVSLLSKQMAVIVSISLVANAGIVILLIWIIFLIFPVREKKSSKVVPASGQLPSKRERFYAAMTSTLVITPVYIIFYYYELTSSMIILIFIAIFSMQPAFVKDFKAGKIVVFSNFIGGLAAILVYNILTVVPELFYFLVLIFASALLFGKQVFSGKPVGGIYGAAFSTFLLIICSVTFSGTAEAGAKVWTRVLQIMIAVVYVVLAFGFIEKYKRLR